MQTTLRLDDYLYREAKAKAALEGVSLTLFIEDALRLRLFGGESAGEDKNAVPELPIFHSQETVDVPPEKLKAILMESEKSVF